MAAIGTALAALAVWLAVDRSMLTGEGAGVGARAVRAVGPPAARIVAWMLAAAMLAMAIGYLRLLGGGRLAARADADGLAIRSLLGDRRFGWDAVASVQVRSVPTPLREVALLQVVGLDGRHAGLASNALGDDAHRMDDWVVGAEARRLARSEDRPGEPG